MINFWALWLRQMGLWMKDKTVIINWHMYIKPEKGATWGKPQHIFSPEQFMQQIVNNVCHEFNSIYLSLQFHGVVAI